MRCRIPGGKWELPPRARRIHHAQSLPHQFRGTTSACAENTTAFLKKTRYLWNYLRVRGEYVIITVTGWKNQELPPRARRIQLCAPWFQQPEGTTSACAENTRPYPTIAAADWNYLRVRGEYQTPSSCGTTAWELPPRARRILTVPLQCGVVAGTTSACAENTEQRIFRTNRCRNYLRVRGEYPK